MKLVLFQCWVPAQFRGGWEEYAEDYCFIENTYHVRLDREIPPEAQRRQETEIGQLIYTFTPQAYRKVC